MNVLLNFSMKVQYVVLVIGQGGGIKVCLFVWLAGKDERAMWSRCWWCWFLDFACQISASLFFASSPDLVETHNLHCFPNYGNILLFYNTIVQRENLAYHSLRATIRQLNYFVALEADFLLVKFSWRVETNL